MTLVVQGMGLSMTLVVQGMGLSMTLVVQGVETHSMQLWGF